MKVLVVDDNPMDLSVAAMFVNKLGYEVVQAESSEDALEVMQSHNPPSIIITDYILPNIDGLSFCQHIRQQTHDLSPYIILMTGEDSIPPDIHTEALHHGADDFIEKPLCFNRLAGSLRAADRVINTQLKLVSLNERLDQLASRDELTDLLNRRAGIASLRVSLSRVERTPDQMGFIALCDVDHFKSINDTYGHPTGDKVLKETARRLKETLRPFDVICRYGGEEFLIFCEASPAQAEGVLKRLLQSLSSQPVRIRSKELSISMSIGCYLIKHPEDLLQTDEMIAYADIALYQAKANGRGCFVIYDDELSGLPRRESNAVN